jgi:hypothetical protein
MSGPKQIYLAVFVNGGNMTGIEVMGRNNTLQAIFDLEPVTRDGDDIPKSDIRLDIDALKPRECVRYEDANGENDISVINVTGVQLKPRMQLW